MKTENFIKDFAEAIDFENASELTKEIEFRKLEEWDSLAYLNVIAMLDEEYDCQLEMAEFKKFKTIDDIIEYIESKK